MLKESSPHEGWPGERKFPQGGSLNAQPGSGPIAINKPISVLAHHTTHGQAATCLFLL